MLAIDGVVSHPRPPEGTRGVSLAFGTLCSSQGAVRGSRGSARDRVGFHRERRFVRAADHRAELRTLPPWCQAVQPGPWASPRSEPGGGLGEEPGPRVVGAGTVAPVAIVCQVVVGAGSCPAVDRRPFRSAVLAGGPWSWCFPRGGDHWSSSRWRASRTVPRGPPGPERRARTERVSLTM